MLPADELGAQADNGAARLPAQAGDAARWSRVKALFLAALEYPETERSAFVREACADDADLHDEVSSLLASDRAAASFAETPAIGVLGRTLAAATAAPRLQPGTRLGAYEISAFLSAGGMGEVYRARHTVLERQVAIKRLNGHPTDTHAKRRLIREARHASMLSHPNICTIYEVGDIDDAPFIVMAFVDGRPLNDIIRSALPALGDTLGYGIQVAAALEHAHEHGIVHCDLKSSNIVVDPTGRPIVLDFGLAKRVRQEETDTSVTIHGALAGTLSHMAPEVLVGGRADARSDVWSLGVLLYELTSGELPFQGRTQFGTSSAILNEPPRPLRSTVPLALRLVIERCLVKDPEARYQSAAAVRAALDAIRRRHAWPLIGQLLVSARRRTLYAVATAAVLAAPLMIAGGRVRAFFGGNDTRISTLALLPFENATGDPGADYYAEGLTDALIAQLGATTRVRVISRVSAARVAQAAPTRADAARQLGADAVVDGRLRQLADRVVVDVRLSEPTQGRVLWSDTYERSAGQALALQADLVRALAAEVRLTVRPDAQARVATVRAVNPEAYEAFLKGRYEWSKRTQTSLDLAIGHFARSIELDPTYAPAHAALADCYNQFGTVLMGTGSPREHRPRAAAAAIRALQIDPYSAEAHAALGYVRHYDWQWNEAEQAFRRAIELNPSYALARIWYANLLMSLGRMDEAVAQVYAARDLDPFSLIINVNVGWTLVFAGRVDDAIAHLTETIALDSTYPQARSRLVGALATAGRHQEELEQAQKWARLTNRSPNSVAGLAIANARLGRIDEARALVTELLERADRGYVPPVALANVFGSLGDLDEALVWLTRAFDERSNAIAYLATDPIFTPLRHDPRFAVLVQRAGLKLQHR